ncbi:glycosyltransferase family 4 protein, partial [Candidatus Uhrbacteria bacterium]|nr:glycosyltransferase family 4 protein [Candidatus Uhrbacteria bacterium]
MLSGLIWPRWLPLIWQIRRIALKEKIEMLQVGQVLPVGTAVYLLTRLYRGWPYIVYAHGMDITLPQRHFFKKRLVRRILASAFKVVTVSQFTKNQLMDFGVPEEKILMVSPGVKVFDLYEDSKLLASETLKKYDLVGKRILLTLSRLVERKGIDTVIKALPSVVAQFPNLIYVVAGSGSYEKSLKELVEKLKLQQHVLFTGLVTDKQKIVWYDLAEIFIMTPRQLPNNDVEGFGIVYMEANGLGKPVIGSLSGGVSEAVIDGFNGLMVQPDNVEQTAEAIVKLLTDTALAKRLGEQGRKRAIEQFAWPIQVAKLNEILA